MIEWTPHLRRLLLGLALAFSALVALRIHGFSLSAWHHLTGDSQPSEVLLGQPRDERFDDWVVQLPMALGQIAHDPPFPLVNRNIGAGQNMLVPIPMPVWHPLALFHPTLWGFFLGRDTGLAWMWWTQALGFFVVWLLVFLVLTRNQLGLSLAASGVLCFAPLMQFYSFNAAPFAIWMGVSWLAAVGIATARRRLSIFACGLLLGWSGACFALTPYPPYQVVLAQLFLVLLVGFGLQRRLEIDVRPQLAPRTLALLLAVAILGVALSDFYVEAREAIAILRHTEYPGMRVAAGGDLSFWKLLAAHLWIPRRVTRLGALGPYLSSSASFWLVWPPLAIAHGWRALARWEAPDPLLLCLAAYCAALSTWCGWGFPGWLAHATGLSLVPAARAVLGLGLADAALLVAFLARPASTRSSVRRADLALALAWTAALVAAALALRAALPEITFGWLALILAANAVATLGLLRRWHPAALTAVLAAGLALCTMWFNPLAVGGSAYLLENPVSREITAIDRRAGGGTVWVSYGDQHVANLFRVLGIRALNGVQPVPQLELWRRVDPDGAESADYNRFGHVYVGLPRPDQGRFGSMDDVIAFYVDPQEGLLASLGVTHLLVHAGAAPLDAYFARFEPLARVGPFSFFELPLRARGSK